MTGTSRLKAAVICPSVPCPVGSSTATDEWPQWDCREKKKPPKNNHGDDVCFFVNTIVKVKKKNLNMSIVYLYIIILIITP